MRDRRVVVIGAGVAGLVAALELAGRGFAVEVAERAAAPGGKMRELEVDGARIDAGPTVLTMRWVFDAILEDLGLRLDDHLTLEPAAILARHAWEPGERLDLHADPRLTAEAIGAFAGAHDARGYLAFRRDARAIYDLLEGPFIKAHRPSLPGLMASRGLKGLPDLLAIRPFTGLWGALGSYFRDPRLRQLFGRYATYCGSSPYRSPATLMLVAHVEQEGVWMVQGGMHRLARALAGLAEARGARIRYGREVERIEVAGGRVSGVVLAGGERLACDAVVAAGDVAALASGLFGEGAARAASRTPPRARSLSAVTWAVRARAGGFPLLRHTVFFSGDYRAEFEAIARGRLPADPTVYVCAQDRGSRDREDPDGPERFLVLVNAPPTGDRHAFSDQEIDPCAQTTFARLARHGLILDRRPEATRVTTPTDFAGLFPATGGALYGRASHGWTASFRRPGARSRIPGLYLAGGSAHPGPGVPMAALSGRAAAHCLIRDSASTAPSRRTAIAGGTSTP